MQRNSHSIPHDNDAKCDSNNRHFGQKSRRYLKKYDHNDEKEIPKNRVKRQLQQERGVLALLSTWEISRSAGQSNKKRPRSRCGTPVDPQNSTVHKRRDPERGRMTTRV